MNEVFGINVVDGGPVALLALVVILVLRGYLIPRKTYDDLLADRDRWQQAHLESEKARLLEHEQTGELLEMAKFGGNLLAALPAPPRSGEEVNPGDRTDSTPPARA